MRTDFVEDKYYFVSGFLGEDFLWYLGKGRWFFFSKGEGVVFIVFKGLGGFEGLRFLDLF